MRLYNQPHEYYAGIDLHARNSYLNVSCPVVDRSRKLEMMFGAAR